VDHELGEGKYTVKITDEDGKLPVNQATEDQWQRLFHLLGVEQSDADVIADSILDWIDGNDLHRLNGAESDYYESLSPPYRAKNGPLDRIEELLLVRGVTPEIFRGQAAGDQPETAVPGLPEVLTANPTGRVNVNTAGPIVLEAWLGLDDRQTLLAVERRTGIDGMAGTEDDLPFRTINEFADLVAGADPALRQRITQQATVASSYFTVRSTGTVGGVQRTVTALLRLQGATVSITSWRERRGTS
jgi:type II secretory pathway component PulK